MAEEQWYIKLYNNKEKIVVGIFSVLCLAFLLTFVFTFTKQVPDLDIILDPKYPDKHPNKTVNDPNYKWLGIGLGFFVLAFGVAVKYELFI